MKHDRLFPQVNAYSTDFGGMNVVYHTRDGPVVANRHDVYVGGSLRHYGEYNRDEWLLLEQIVTPGCVAVEVGANYGSHTINIARKAGPGGTVHAIEPQRLVFQGLCASVALNGLANVRCHQVAAGNRSGSLTVPPLDYSKPNNIGGVALAAQGPGETVALVRLDDLIQTPALRLIKIDVEGMEQEVVEGARGLIAAHRPFLYVENDRRDRSAALIETIRALGYRMYWHLPPLFSPQNYFAETENIFGGNVVSVNLFCVPGEAEHRVDGLQEATDPEFHPIGEREQPGTPAP